MYLGALAFAVLIGSVCVGLLLSSSSPTTCQSAEDCDCPPGWSGKWCHEGNCFTGRADTRCDGKEDNFQLGYGEWCWKGDANTKCGVNVNWWYTLGFAVQELAFTFLPQLEMMSLKMLSPQGAEEVIMNKCNHIEAEGFNVPDGPNRKAWQAKQVRMGRHKYILAGMEFKKSSPKVQNPCIGALCAIAIFNQETHRDVAESGGLEVIMDVARNHRDNEYVNDRICGQGVGCLSDEYQANRDRFRELGAVQYCIRAWDTFPNNALIRFGVGAAFSGMSYDNPINKRKIVDGGFVERGLQGMIDHPNSEQRVREEVMMAMNGLTGQPYVPEIHDLLIQKGLLDSMLTLYRENMDHDVTMNNANLVLLNLMGASEKNTDLIVEKGFHKYLAKLIFHFEGKAGWALYVRVDATACNALVLMAANNKTNRLAVLNTNAKNNAHKAFMFQPTDSGVQEWCRKLIDLSGA